MHSHRIAEDCRGPELANVGQAPMPLDRYKEGDVTSGLISPHQPSGGVYPSVLVQRLQTGPAHQHPQGASSPPSPQRTSSSASGMVSKSQAPSFSKKHSRPNFALHSVPLRARAMSAGARTTVRFVCSPWAIAEAAVWIREPRPSPRVTGSARGAEAAGQGRGQGQDKALLDWRWGSEDRMKSFARTGQTCHLRGV
jgi:hypothetical protein